LKIGTFLCARFFFAREKETELPYKLMKKFKVVEKLPTRDQNAIFHYINALVEKNKTRENEE